MLKPIFCKKENFNKLINFLEKNWTRKNILFKNKKLFNWLYYNKKNKTYNFLITEEEKKIFSCMGILKNNINLKKIHNEIKKGVIWLTMWTSIPYKNYNTGLVLIYYFIKNYKNYFVGTVGCSETTFLIYKNLGFKTGFLNHHYFLNFKIKKFSLAKVKKNENSIIKKNNLYIKISKSINFYKENQNLKSYEKKYLKNFFYFKSKYYNNPFYDYRFYQIKKRNIILGFFVGRICVYKGKKALRFVEYFGSKSALGNIKYGLTFFLNKTNYEYVDFYNAGIENKFLKKSGFKLNKFKKDIVIPNYFEPFKRENIKLRYAIWPDKKILPIFKGDCDQDRPNVI
jgi:hypothetical protein